MREYYSYLTEVFNLKNFDINGKVELQTAYEKSQDVRREYLEMKKKGEL